DDGSSEDSRASKIYHLEGTEFRLDIIRSAYKSRTFEIRILSFIELRAVEHREEKIHEALVYQGFLLSFSSIIAL
ncbi:hypothetical protein, partial [uncultured Parasutterella sp.]